MDILGDSCGRVDGVGLNGEDEETADTILKTGGCVEDMVLCGAIIGCNGCFDL